MNGIGAEPRSDSLIVLIPSPLLGPYSWSLVQDELAERGWEALVSVDLHDPVGRQPCWRRTVGGVEATLRDSEDERSVVLIAHSGAGPLLPAIGAIVQQPIAAYLFVDAGLPSGGTSRLEAIATEDAISAAELRAALDAGRRFPAWTDKDLGQLVPERIGGRRCWTSFDREGATIGPRNCPTLAAGPTRHAATSRSALHTCPRPSTRGAPGGRCATYQPVISTSSSIRPPWPTHSSTCSPNSQSGHNARVQPRH